MSIVSFFEQLRENELANANRGAVRVNPQPTKSSEELMSSTDEKSAQEGDAVNGLKWGNLNSNQHGFVNYCMHALGLGVRGKRSHNTRDDFTIS